MKQRASGPLAKAGAKGDDIASETKGTGRASETIGAEVRPRVPQL